MRSVRRVLRHEVLASVSAGEGDLPTLIKIAGRLLGRDVGYEVLIKTFLANEVSNALAHLRTEGHVESTGRVWKPMAALQGEDVDIVSTRRLKRLRGELKAQVRLAHDHGRVPEAIAADKMLSILGQQLAAIEDAPQKSEEAVE
jgi:hypothetical protein